MGYGYARQLLQRRAVEEVMVITARDVHTSG